MSKLMAGISGVRGIVGETLTPQVASTFAAHFGVMQNRGKIIVGRDSRTTGETLFYAVVSGLLSVGCEVIDIGIVSTPTVLFNVKETDAVGGISITASHNPTEWNGLKFVDGNGLFLFPEKAKNFLMRIKEDIPFSFWDKMGKLSKDTTAINRHITRASEISYVNKKEIQDRKFKVVIDCVNGAGGLVVPPLLQRLGCEIIELNCEPSGLFAHSPEPLNKNLRQLEAAVIEHNADIGFAVDPDVDRLAIVSEKGIAVGEEMSLVIAEKFVLSKVKGDIVTNMSSSMASDDIAKDFGVNVIRTKVGEINVGMKMMEISSPIGGEGNGGIICSDVHFTRDASAGITLILAYLAENKTSVSATIDTIPQYFFAKNKIVSQPEKLDGIVEKAMQLFANEKQDHTDGLKIIGDSYWLHIRKSGTEPIVRVYVEADSAERAEKICADAIKNLS